MNIVIRVLREAPLALASLSLLISAAARADTIHAEPAGKWQVYYEDWDCALRRDLLIAGSPAISRWRSRPRIPLPRSGSESRDAAPQATVTRSSFWTGSTFPKRSAIPPLTKTVIAFES